MITFLQHIQAADGALVACVVMFFDDQYTSASSDVGGELRMGAPSSSWCGSCVV